MLAAVFYLWGLILLIRGGRAGKSHLYMPALAGACFCYLLSLLCKEIAVTLPLVYILYRCCWNGEKSFWRERDCLIPMLFLLGTLGLYLAARTFAVGLNSHQSIPPHWYSPGQRSWLVAITLGFYLQKLFYPLRLCYYSNIVVPGSFVEDVLTSPLLWIGLGGMTSFFLALRFSPRGAFALGWIGLTLLPVLNIIMIPALAKENYLYLPSVGFCLLLTIALPAVVNRCDVTPAYRKTLACSTILMIGFLYSVATTTRNAAGFGEGMQRRGIPGARLWHLAPHFEVPANIRMEGGWSFTGWVYWQYTVGNFHEKYLLPLIAALEAEGQPDKADFLRGEWRRK